eukprot:Rmarinus@m.26091
MVLFLAALRKFVNSENGELFRDFIISCFAPICHEANRGLILSLIKFIGCIFLFVFSVASHMIWSPMMGRTGSLVLTSTFASCCGLLLVFHFKRLFSDALEMRSLWLPAISTLFFFFLFMVLVGAHMFEEPISNYEYYGEQICILLPCVFAFAAVIYVISHAIAELIIRYSEKKSDDAPALVLSHCVRSRIMWVLVLTLYGLHTLWTYVVYNVSESIEEFDTYVLNKDAMFYCLVFTIDMLGNIALFMIFHGYVLHRVLASITFFALRSPESWYPRGQRGSSDKMFVTCVAFVTFVMTAPMLMYTSRYIRMVMNPIRSKVALYYAALFLRSMALFGSLAMTYLDRFSRPRDSNAAAAVEEGTEFTDVARIPAASDAQTPPR